jgi:hypothetical protein
MVAVVGRCLQICRSDYSLCFIDCKKLQTLEFLFQQTFLLIYVLFADSYNVYNAFICYINSHFVFLHKTAIMSLFYVTICISDFYTMLDIFYTISIWSYCLYVLSVPYFRCFSCVPYLYVWQSLHLSKCIPLCEYGSDLICRYFFVWLSNDIRSFWYYIYVCKLK